MGFMYVIFWWYFWDIITFLGGKPSCISCWYHCMLSVLV